MENFAYAIMLISVLGAFTMGLSGLYLNFKYPKSKLEIAEMKLLSAEQEIRRLLKLVDEWRSRAEQCEQLVVRSMQDSARSGGVTIRDSDVKVGRDLFGGDSNRRDDVAVGNDLTVREESPREE